MSENMSGTRFDMTTPHLRVLPEDMPQQWRRVSNDLKARGFGIAATNMREIIRAITPRMYFNTVAATNPIAGPIKAE